MISLPIKAGEFFALDAFSGTISAGVTGDILTITPPPGRRVRVTHLSTPPGASQAGISMGLGSETIVSEVAINGDAPSAGAVSVGEYQEYTAGAPPSGNYPFWTGAANEVAVISKNAGNTTQTIYYGYEFGE